MIKTAHIENIGCIRKLDLSLSPLTVFVGPNSSGKSTLLRALGDRNSHQLPTWQNQGGTKSVGVDTGDRLYEWLDTGRYSQGQLPPYQLLRLDLASLRQANVLKEETGLDEVGSNLANVVASLGRRIQDKLAHQLCELVPMFRDIDVIPTQQGQHEVRFEDRWKPGLWYGPNRVSDGTMLLLAFLVLQYQREPVDVVAIEEPERGLHPYLIGELISLLRGFTTGRHGGKRFQVLMATHSAELLDFVRPEEVRFVNRSAEDGSMTVAQVDTSEPGWEQAFKEYRESLGQAWLAGGLGGVPGG